MQRRLACKLVDKCLIKSFGLGDKSACCEGIKTTLLDDSVSSVRLASSPDSCELGNVRFPYDGKLKVSYGNRSLPSSRESGDKAMLS